MDLGLAELDFDICFVGSVTLCRIGWIGKRKVLVKNVLPSRNLRCIAFKSSLVETLVGFDQTVKILRNVVFVTSQIERTAVEGKKVDPMNLLRACLLYTSDAADE